MGEIGVAPDVRCQLLSFLITIYGRTYHSVGLKSLPLNQLIGTNPVFISWMTRELNYKFNPMSAERIWAQVAVGSFYTRLLKTFLLTHLKSGFLVLDAKTMFGSIQAFSWPKLFLIPIGKKK